MSATHYPQTLAARFISRRIMLGMPKPVVTRGFADQTPHRPNMSGADRSDPINLKKLGATRTVRIVVYSALGVAAVAETTFWCSWLWSKAFKRVADEPEQRV